MRTDWLIIMKIKFLGTAAAEGVPAVFCKCKTCEAARKCGGRNIRTRSQILIDDDMLFDFPMDTYMHALRFGLDLSAITCVLVTHAHMDHCYPQEFVMRGAPFAYNMSQPRVRIYGNAAVMDIFEQDTAREIRPEIKSAIDFVVLKPYDVIDDGKTRIIALPAEHTKGEECLVYYIERAGKGIALLNDTGILNAEVFKRLKTMGATLSLAAFDCTYGAKRHGAGRHMGLYDIVDQLSIMQDAQLLDNDFRAVATHFSHNTELDYKGMCAAAAKFNISVAFDGMEISV